MYNCLVNMRICRRYRTILMISKHLDQSHVLRSSDIQQRFSRIGTVLF